VDNLKEFNSAKKGNSTYKIVIGILVVLLLGLGYLFRDQQQETTKIISALTVEKDELTFEYQDLIKDYDEIETTNDSISSQLASEKERIEELVAVLKTTKAQNRSEINKYKRELKTLRGIMKGFIHQIDSLNTINIELTAENVEIKKQYKTAQSKNKKLAEKYDEAAEQVKIASVIRAVNISIASLNHKGKSTNRAKKTKRFAINFTLDENSITPTGTKNVYLRITDPNQHILIQNNQPVFSYEGEEIAYSSVREVEYDGSIANAVIYFEYNGTEALPKGSYNVDIFCDGNMIGTSTVILK
jgi:hypothetical protein